MRHRQTETYTNTLGQRDNILNVKRLPHTVQLCPKEEEAEEEERKKTMTSCLHVARAGYSLIPC